MRNVVFVFRALLPALIFVTLSMSLQAFQANVGDFATDNETYFWMGYKLRAPSRVPSEYMVHLYQLLKGTHSHTLKKTEIISFVNIHDGGKFSY